MDEQTQSTVPTWFWIAAILALLFECLGCYFYLAEVTMSIMQKLKSRDPNAGYATDFVEMLRRILPRCKQKGIKVVANAGGVNPRGCLEAIRKVGLEPLSR